MKSKNVIGEYGPIETTVGVEAPFSAISGDVAIVSTGIVEGNWILTWRRNGQDAPPTPILGPIRVEAKLDGGDYVIGLQPVGEGPHRLTTGVVLMTSEEE